MEKLPSTPKTVDDYYREMADYVSVGDVVWIDTAKIGRAHV